MSKDEQAIGRMFDGYVQAFQTLEPRSVAFYCHVPCVFIAPQGVRVMTSPSEVESLLAAMMSALQRRGYGRSEIADMSVNRVSNSGAVVSVRRIRYRTDGSELERLGETYMLREVDRDWKIVAAMVHDPGAILALV